MKKKHTLKIAAILFLLLIIITFFLITEKISQSHKIEHSSTKAENYESYIKKYGTGETLPFSYFTSNSGITEDTISYIILKVYEKNEASPKTSVGYYIKDRAIIKKVYDVLNQTEYMVSNMDFRNNSNEYLSACRIQFIGSGENSLDWHGYYTPSDDTYIFLAGLLSSTNLLGIDAQWVDKYYYYGFFADSKIMQTLNDIMENDIKQITIEEIRTILSVEEIPVIQDFYGYLHTQTDHRSSITEPLESFYYEYRLDISDYDGYLLIRNADWSSEYSMGQDIFGIYLYDMQGNLLETLYEK